jgi:hypothetical protein
LGHDASVNGKIGFSQGFGAQKGRAAFDIPGTTAADKVVGETFRRNLRRQGAGVTVIYFGAEKAKPFFFPNHVGIFHLFTKADGFCDTVSDGCARPVSCFPMKHELTEPPDLASILVPREEKGQPDSRAAA